MAREKLFSRAIILSAVLAAMLFVGSVIPAVPASLSEDVANDPRPDVEVTEIKTTPGLVEPIDVLTLNTTVHNSSERADGLVLEITVTDPSGQTVQNMRQRNIGVDPSDDMAVYWVWRIPQRLSDGTYSVQVTVYEPDGVSILSQSQKREAFAVMKSERETAYAH